MELPDLLSRRQGLGETHIVRETINFCWRCFKWGAGVALLLLVTVGGYLYFKLDDEITRYARTLLTEHYRSHDVRVVQARYVSGSGVVISGVVIAQPHPGGESRPLLEIEELRLIGAIDSQSFTTRKPRIDRIEVVRPRLTATKLASGQWDVQSLLPLPEGDGGAAPVHIHNATVVVADATKPNAKPLALRNVSLQLTATPTAPNANRIDVRGRAEDTLAQLIEFQGSAADDGSQVDFRVDVKQLGVTTERLLAAPGLPTLLLAGLKVDAKIDAQTSIKRQSAVAPFNWRCDFNLRQGTLTHPLVPKRLTEVEITGQCDPTGLRVSKASASSGEAELTGALNQMGWGPEARASCKIDARNLALSPDLRRALPASLLGAWDRFEPRGTADATANLWIGGGRVWSDVTLTGRGLSFEDKKRFPYRVSSGTGVMRYIDTKTRDQSRLTLSFDAKAEGRPVRIEGELKGLPCKPSEAGECPLGYLRVTANSLRVTKSLVDALPDTAESVLRKLRPEGEFGLVWQMRRDSAEQAAPSFSMDMLVHDGSIRFAHFPYPVRGIRGKVSQRDKQWTFSEFVSRGEDGVTQLAANGRFDESAPRPRLTLRIDGVGLPLDQTLSSCLSPELRQAWASLRPSGRMDFESTIDYSHGDRLPKLTITAKPHADTVSLLPTCFPYRLEHLTGEFIATEREVRFIDARARHGVTRLLADGYFKSLSTGGWSFELQDLSVDRLSLNGDFRAAAPVGLRKVIDRLEPAGGVGVHHGRLTFTQGPNPAEPLRTTWDLQVDCQQLDVNAGVRVDDLFGVVRVKGSGTGDHGVSHGELALESLLWNGMQLTNVTGPLYCDQNECRLGRGVAHKLGGQPRAVVGRAYGGVASLDARALFEGRTSYGLDFSIDAVDLERFSADYLHSSTTLSGKLNGSIQLQGAGDSIYGLTGAGKLSATEANLYELPLLVSMLKVLSNRAPDTKAFDRVDAEFTMQGEHLTFQKLDMLGDAISLYGRGEASLDRQVNLVFHTMVGRSSLVTPVLRSLMGQASEQFLKLIVTGPIENAVVTREALPLINNAIQQLQQDLTPRPLSRPAAVPNAAAQRRSPTEIR